MLVSAFLAATALTQFVGGSMVMSAPPCFSWSPAPRLWPLSRPPTVPSPDVHKEQLNNASGQIPAAELMEMVAGLDELPTRPGGLFLIGYGVDHRRHQAHLEEATSLTVNRCGGAGDSRWLEGRPWRARMRHYFASSTAALAYAQDPGDGCG